MGKIADMDLTVAEIEKWICAQDNLPASIDKLLLQRFIYTCVGDLDKTKQLIELNYAMRHNHPHIFLKRDPTDSGSAKLLEIADLVPLPALTKDRSKVLVYRLIDFDPDKFSLTDGVKVFFMLADCRFVKPDEQGLADGEIPIFDMEGFSLRHLTKVVFSISALRVYMKFVQEAHPVRLKEIHVLNCPSYLDKVLTVVKPFIRSDVFKLIKFHLPGSETLYDYIPKDMLPEEYGGTSCKMADLKKQWVSVMTENRDYLMNQNHWKGSGAKTHKSRENDCSSDTIATFNTLSID